MRTIPLRTAAALIALLAIRVAAAQETKPTTANSASAPTVKLGLLVTDKSNHSMDDLKRDELQVLEDKVPQTISSFAKDDRIINYALVVDNSGSFKDILTPAIEAAKLLVSKNGPADEVFIERFINSNKIETVQEFTSDQATLNKALETLIIEGGQSAVVDAVYLAVAHTAEYQSSTDRRRALVIFTDGEDRASYYSANDLFKLLRKNDVQIFVIGVVTQLSKGVGIVRPSPRASAEELLNRMARETGGRVFFPRDIEDLLRAATEIAHDLHTQYSIDYQPTNNSGKTGFRKVEIRIAETPGRDKLTAIARPGYLVTPEKSNAKESEKKKTKPE